MCFGNTVTTEQKSSNNTLPDYLENAARQNVANAQAITSRPFTSYTGELAAPLSPDEQQAGSLLRGIAPSSNPYSANISALYGQYANAPAGTVRAPSLLGPNVDVNSASLTDYMNPYVSSVLSPQLADIDRQSVAQQKALDARATFSGAFGDARHGIEAAKQVYDANRLRADTIGQAYNNAFNTAAGLRGSDITNALSVQNQNNANREAALQRAATGASDLMNLDQHDTQRATGLAQALAQQGAAARGAQQQADTAAYNEFLRAQNYSPQMAQLLTSILSGTPHDTSSSSTTQAPDNTGYGLLGAIAGTALPLAAAPFTGGLSLAAAPMALGSFSKGSTGGTGGLLGGLY